MFEFSKTILQRVSFDKSLFSKELRKLILWYGNDTEQISIFHQWCLKNFGKQYPDVIEEGFKTKFS
jgi:hypothetical protein